MKNLDDLRRDRQSAAQKMQQVALQLGELEGAADTDDAALAAAQTEFDSAETDFQAADRAVKRMEAVEAAQAAAATGDAGQGTGGQGTGGQGGQTAPAQAQNPAHQGLEVGFMALALAANRGDVTRAVAQLERDGHSGIGAALNSTSESAGGVLVPRPMAAQMIELLRPRVVVRKAGARTVPMSAGELRHAKQTGGATASYGGEMDPIEPSEPSFDKIDRTLKKLRALVPVSNTLLNRATIGTATVVRDDMLKVMALREDLAFLRNDGSGDLPKGLRYWALSAHWDAGPVAATANAADLAIRRAVSLVEDANVSMITPGWTMRAGAKSWLASLRDANGNLLYPEIDAKGTLKGFPIYTTSQIPNNLGVGGNETEITFADFSEMMIGEGGEMRIAQSTEAAFVDASGDTQSAFQNDLTLFRAITEHDFAPEHDEAIAGFNAADWSLQAA
tara:strand:- start:7288 stop:8631 length:1344 start_codon:yes stop_codon:yes gene_type:complete